VKVLQWKEIGHTWSARDPLMPYQLQTSNKLNIKNHLPWYQDGAMGHIVTLLLFSMEDRSSHVVNG
jgi:hypothetical protein